MIEDPYQSRKTLDLIKEDPLDFPYISTSLSKLEYKAYQKMMIARLEKADLKKAMFESLIKKSKYELAKTLNNDQLRRLLTVINKKDFMMNFSLSEDEYMWLELTLDIINEKKEKIWAFPQTSCIMYYFSDLQYDERGATSKKLSPLRSPFKFKKGNVSDTTNTYHNEKYLNRYVAIKL